MGAGEGKNAKFWAPHPSGPCPWGLHFFWVWLPTLLGGTDSETTETLIMAKIGLAKIGLAKNWPGLKHDGQIRMAKNGLAKNGLSRVS